MKVFGVILLGAMAVGGIFTFGLAVIALVGFLVAWIAMLAWGSLLHMTGWDIEYGLPFLGFWQTYMIIILLGIFGSFFKSSSSRIED